MDFVFYHWTTIWQVLLLLIAFGLSDHLDALVKATKAGNAKRDELAALQKEEFYRSTSATGGWLPAN